MSVWDFLVSVYKFLVDTLTIYGVTIMALLLSIITSALKSIKRKGKLDWVEALICGCLTLAVSSTLQYLKLSSEISIFLGGLIGFKGSLWVDARINKDLGDDKQ
ncbi:phage holin family protein [Acinetobacter populi]|uniref:Holin n=1 Tax=Acinetobacter populi TaxID=1582270 RepID=A0A1Z9YZK5_9GAMM|nr:phage holin family protein [Acinetobacter populi]OUY07634.1 holin [Acinetobacter populi]